MDMYFTHHMIYNYLQQKPFYAMLIRAWQFGTGLYFELGTAIQLQACFDIESERSVCFVAFSVSDVLVVPELTKRRISPM